MQNIQRNNAIQPPGCFHNEEVPAKRDFASLTGKEYSPEAFSWSRNEEAGQFVASPSGRTNFYAQDVFMDKQTIIDKFGSAFIANEHTYKMGIDIRFTDHLALRFKNLTVLETCSGGGFSSISLARYAKHVYSFDIDQSRIRDARANAVIAGVDSKITFLHDDIYNGIKQTELMGRIEASFIDPDWADTGSHHIYKFINSNTRPPSDHLLTMILKLNSNVTLIQPPFIPVGEFSHLPNHELECLYMNNSLELYCLHFGILAATHGMSEYRV